jgi:hypothetical protein
MEDQGAILASVGSEAPSSQKFYKDTLVQGSSRLHAGDVYGNVVHSMLAQYLISCSYSAIQFES